MTESAGTVRERDNINGIIRQLATDVAKMQGRDEARDQRLSGIETDVREARDGVRELASIQAEQNFPRQVSEIRSEFKALDNERRQDLINATTRLRNEALAMNKRIETLENAALGQAASWTFLRVIKDYWALISSAIVVGTALLFGKIKIG